MPAVRIPGELQTWQSRNLLIQQLSKLGGFEFELDPAGTTLSWKTPKHGQPDEKVAVKIMIGWLSVMKCLRR